MFYSHVEMSKNEIVIKVKEELERKLLDLRMQTKALQVDVGNESKSSAGDKHETSRAMMNLEQEKLGRQLQELLMMKDKLEKINFENPSDRIQIGSLIDTNKGQFLLSVGMGKILFQQQNILLLSLQSPLGVMLLGKKVGDIVKMNAVQYTIENIE